MAESRTIFAIIALVLVVFGIYYFTTKAPVSEHTIVIKGVNGKGELLYQTEPIPVDSYLDTQSIAGSTKPDLSQVVAWNITYK